MTLDQHIAELRAELDHCLLTQSERGQIRAELEAALRDRARALVAEASWVDRDGPNRAAA